MRDSFAKAKKEICAHKWIDISDEMHGAALLNDCKYGYRVWDCVLDIDLLRSSMYPGVDADKGTHVFTYSFYPHKDNYVNQLTAEGYFLNTPPVPCGKVRGELCGVPLFDCGAENVAIDWVKPSEDGSGVIVRAYEFAGDAAEAEIKPAPFFKLGAPVLCDLTENELTPAGNKIKFGGYEINTVKFPFIRNKHRKVSV